MKNKSFPAGLMAIVLLSLVMATGALAQPSVHDVAGPAFLNGAAAPVGAVVVAKDSLGTERGNFTITSQGTYGILHINGDDQNSTGEIISFFINGAEALQTLTWQHFGYNPDFRLDACDLSTFSVVAHLDSLVYNPGSQMTLTGYLLNSQCGLEPGRTVAYSVPSTAIMGQIQTNGTGYFTEALVLPSDIAEGNYTLWVSYPPLTNDTVFTTVNFTVSVDIDGDGYNYSSDCNDTNPGIHPGAADACGNGIDEDCSGADSACTTVSSSSSGGGGGGYYCPNNWTCTEWSACQPNGTQTRVCTDSMKCLVSLNKPAESQVCTYVQPAEVTACTPGARVCIGSDLMECSQKKEMVKIQTCEFGCSADKCLEGPGAEETGEVIPSQEGAPVAGFFLLEPSAWPYWIAIVVLAAIVVWFILRKRNKPEAQPKE